jgi:hypothetical protein
MSPSEFLTFQSNTFGHSLDFHLTKFILSFRLAS